MSSFRTPPFALPILALVLLGATIVRPASAQEDHHDHEESVHFSHPLVNESPSPDTKLRLDYLWSRTGDPQMRVVERSMRLEGEYELAPGISLAATMPYVWRDGSGGEAVRGLGNTELSLKFASTHWGEHGVLVGGGLDTGLPTGSDARGIGSSRSVELEPFADVGVMRGRLQLVAFGRFGATVHDPAGVEAEREFSFAASALYPVTRRVEALLEVNAARPVEGLEQTTSSSFAPGLKLYPFANRAFMFGVSAPIGMSGEDRHARELLTSFFWHF